MRLIVRLFGKNYYLEGSKYQKKANGNDYYPKLILCLNCNRPTQIYIKKGVHVNDIITQVKCSSCECRQEKI